ncbi:MAG: hypothetical protein C0623_05570 [Desulfuromonas sp.]|nr:MAG: hypothetical protein C0623_05570 [Desulfuromonas sp.]
MKLKNKHFIYINLVVILLGLLLIWYAGRPKPEQVVKVKQSVHDTTGEKELAQRDVTLYFASPGGLYLVSETRQIGCSDETDCIRTVVEALASGPVQAGLEVVPAKTLVRSVEVDSGTAIIDFNQEFVSGHPGGSHSELMTVYALANSVAVNFPHLRQISVLVEGKPVKTLKGHVDLRRPLIADFTFARPPGGGLKQEVVKETRVKE